MNNERAPNDHIHMYTYLVNKIHKFNCNAVVYWMVSIAIVVFPLSPNNSAISLECMKARVRYQPWGTNKNIMEIIVMEWVQHWFQICMNIFMIIQHYLSLSNIVIPQQRSGRFLQLQLTWFGYSLLKASLVLRFNWDHDIAVMLLHAHLFPMIWNSFYCKSLLVNRDWHLTTYNNKSICLEANRD
jgi:hypothetical protein